MSDGDESTKSTPVSYYTRYLQNQENKGIISTNPKKGNPNLNKNPLPTKTEGDSNDAYKNVCNSWQRSEEEITNTRPTWKELTGNQDVKEELSSKLFRPLVFPKLFGKTKVNLLAIGPPGTGKTVTILAMVKELNENYGEYVKVLLFTPSIGQLGTKYQNEGANIIAGGFECASRMASELDTVDGVRGVAIIFIDEFEAIAKSRETASTEESKVINTLLPYLEGGKTKDNIVFIAASNLLSKIDAGIRSRFDVIYILPPKEHEVKDQLNNDFQRYWNSVLKTSKDYEFLRPLLTWGLETDQYDLLAKRAKEYFLAQRDLRKLVENAKITSAEKALKLKLFYKLKTKNEKGVEEFHYLSLNSIPPELWYSCYKLLYNAANPKENALIQTEDEVSFERTESQRIIPEIVRNDSNVKTVFVNALFLPFISKSDYLIEDIFIHCEKLEEFHAKIFGDLKEKDLATIDLAKLLSIYKEKTTLTASNSTSSVVDLLTDVKIDVIIDKKWKETDKNLKLVTDKDFINPSQTSKTWKENEFTFSSYKVKILISGVTPEEKPNNTSSIRSFFKASPTELELATSNLFEARSSLMNGFKNLSSLLTKNIKSTTIYDNLNTSNAVYSRSDVTLKILTPILDTSIFGTGALKPIVNSKEEIDISAKPQTNKNPKNKKSSSVGVSFSEAPGSQIFNFNANTSTTALNLNFDFYDIYDDFGKRFSKDPKDIRFKTASDSMKEANGES